MSDNSKIEWTDHTFNPWWGCQKVGPGCDHCYAEALDKRTGGAHWGPHADRRRTKDWGGPRRWQKNATKFMFEHHRRQRVFCASMADVFDNAVPAEWRADLWQVIRETPDLDWLLVTKRIGNAPAMVPPDWPTAFPHVTLLITVVNQEEADRDVPKLLAMPAARRGISAEPLLGPIDFTRIKGTACLATSGSCCGGATVVDALRGIQFCERAGAYSYPEKYGTPRGLDWIIVGGESGANARPMHPDWARSIRDQCNPSSGVSFFFKQWGEWISTRSPRADDLLDARRAVIMSRSGHVTTGLMQAKDFPTVMERVGKARAGRLLDGREWNEYPEGRQQAAAPSPGQPAAGCLEPAAQRAERAP